MEKQIATIPRRKRFANIIKNGLFLYGLRNRLALIGLDFEPYYWELEGGSLGNPPEIRGNSDEFSLVFLQPSEIRELCLQIPGYNMEPLEKSLLRDPTCIGLKTTDGKIAAYMLIDTDTYSFKNTSVPLKANEAYLQSMWTFHEYRGRNLAPYLRYKSYELMQAEGRNQLYSVTSYFNKSSLRFKEKLGMKHHSLRMSIVLFRKFFWDFRLKSFPEQPVSANSQYCQNTVTQ